MKKKIVVFTIVAAGLCSLLAMASAAGIWYLRRARQTDAGPKVLIQSLRHGQQVAVGQRLPIQVTASAESNIKRVELWVDGNLYEAQTSVRAEGTPLLPMTTYWQPDSAGTHTLIARAFDAQDNRVSVSVQVTGILESAQDNDEDTLSDEAELIRVNVSADTDGDGVPNAADPCPDEVGPAGSDGCPTPTEEDQDGDGLLNDEDLCPDTPGGSMTYGCPDGDGDGVRDDEDLCADQPGLPGNDGCPPSPAPTPRPSGDDEEDNAPVSKAPGDADDDGVPDEQDLCPEVEGAAENGGCPPGPDGDGDGIADEWDPCPDEAGLPEHAGCPPPSPGTSTRPDDLPGWMEESPGEITGPIVEFQALTFEVDGEYDDVYCYVRLEGLDVGRHELATQGAGQWDLATALGSQYVVVEEEPLDVMIECGALVYDPAGETLPTHYDLGTMTVSHPSSDWDGRVLFATSSGGEGVQFNMEYRLCLGTCDETAFPPPVLQLYEGSAGQYLGWTWSGDYEEIDGFHVFVDGNHDTDVFGDANVTSVSRYMPLCGRGHTFTVSAFRLGWGESPQSNQVTWTADPCPRVVRVTFYHLHTYDIGGPGLVGPVFGSFGAWSESDGELLAFNGSDYPDGVGFAPNSIYSVQGIFDSIRGWLEEVPRIGPGCSLFPDIPWCDIPFVSAPEVDYVTVELGPDDDLMFGGTIFIQCQDTYLELFNANHTLPAGEITPGYYTLHSGAYRLDVIVDVIVGPEAGDKPDLVVSRIVRIVNGEGSGQLRVYVFNNAADLVDSQVEITFQRISTGQIISVETWEGITIPSGGEVILQTIFPADAHDLRIILDPEDDIDEMYDENNIYETE